MRPVLCEENSIRLLQKKVPKDRIIVIIGNGEHPEVEGIRGWAGEHVSWRRRHLTTINFKI